MYKFFLTIILGSIGYLCYSQQASNTSYWLATEGGGRNIIVDTVTPTIDLIKMLEQPWSFKNTGKAYYIGFTELMFSIAHKGDLVVDTLIDYYKTTPSDRAKHGIIYTLYLIGIERETGSRLNEPFKNKKARKALLSLLRYSSNNATIARLLMRDPWLSDIPELIDYLNIEKNTEYTWPIVKALMRYNAPGFCIGQSLKDKGTYHISRSEAFKKIDHKNSINSLDKTSLKLFEEKYSESICVTPLLFEQDLAGDYKTGSNENISLIEFSGSHITGTEDYFSSYIALGSRFVHYVEGDIIHFCSIEIAQKRIIDWWAGLTSTGQAFFKDKNVFNPPWPPLPSYE
ncbi:MAG: hypothetical protein EOP54_06235 [Sphingobacteriales bacterium]|nr:MAG: hypothetical protein EOP54_06235 [Sphingobacteriales bacterium]